MRRGSVTIASSILRSVSAWSPRASARDATAPGGRYCRAYAARGRAARPPRRNDRRLCPRRSGVHRAGERPAAASTTSSSIASVATVRDSAETRGHVLCPRRPRSRARQAAPRRQAPRWRLDAEWKSLFPRLNQAPRRCPGARFPAMIPALSARASSTWQVIASGPTSSIAKGPRTRSAARFSPS